MHQIRMHFRLRPILVRKKSVLLPVLIFTGGGEEFCTGAPPLAHLLFKLFPGHHVDFWGGLDVASDVAARRVVAMLVKRDDDQRQCTG